MAKKETLMFRCPADLKEALIRDARDNDRKIQDSAIHLIKRGIEVVEKEKAALRALRSGMEPVSIVPETSTQNQEKDNATQEA